MSGKVKKKKKKTC